MPLRVTRGQALAWRMRRQHLLAGAADSTEVVRTLAAVSVFGSDPDLSVRRRLASPGAAGGGAAGPHRRPTGADVLVPRVGAGDGARDRGHLPRAPVGGTAVGAEELGRALPARSRRVARPAGGRPRGRRVGSGATAGGRRRARRPPALRPPGEGVRGAQPHLPQALRVAGRHRARPRPLRPAGAAEPRAGARVGRRAGPRGGGTARRPRVRRRLRPDHAGTRRPLARRRVERRPEAAGAVVARGRGRPRRGRRRGRGALAPRVRDRRPQGHPARADGGAAAGQGRLGDGPGHAGFLGRAGRAPHRHDPRGQPRAGRRRRGRHVAGPGRRARGRRPGVGGAGGRGDPAGVLLGADLDLRTP